MGSCAGKVVWVTGASRGLGKAIAVALAEAGAHLALSSRTKSDLVALIEQLPGDSQFEAFPVSVDDPTAVRDCATEVARRFGRLDGLVNCAGISPTFVRSAELSDEAWQEVINVNLRGTFLCAREAGRAMLEQGYGSIVNVTSVHAWVGFERLAAYAASKGGIEALTRTLAVEWAPQGVRVNALAPGYYRTDLSRGLLDSPRGDRIRARVPMGRTGEPEELGGAATFLLSDAASYVTGTTITVDGGWTAW